MSYYLQFRDYILWFALELSPGYTVKWRKQRVLTMLPVCKEEGEIRKQIYLQILPKRNARRVNQKLIKLGTRGASLVAQWLRIRLPMQGTRVRALVGEDPTCHGATKPVHHNYWACALEPVSHNYWARVPQLLKATRLEPMLRSKRSHCIEKPAHCNKK